MLRSLARRGIAADMVVGSSVGALNGVHYAGDPTIEGIRRLETIWRGLRRRDVFPLTRKTMIGFMYRRDFLVTSDGLRQLVDRNLPYLNREDAPIPIHIVTTDILTGRTVVLSKGSAAQAIIASAAIPAAFAPVQHGDLYLADGAVSSNTPVKVAVAQGARRLIVLPTGLRLCPRQAACGRCRECAACVDAACRAAIVERTGGIGRQHQFFRPAANLPSGRVAL
ncbi:patatin-like phospholipase family protein [Mesorhizobium comanense]|uniref:patatin-like phospholipase family protein n=1 Tax=Mesorhizobium comanense TaxID=2502215 RepID=UPI001E44EEC5|nr:patatin-like phospholipase family protein [Mesorhizobium comanense]